MVIVSNSSWMDGGLSGVSSNLVKGSSCLLGQETLPLLLNIDWFQNDHGVHV